MLGPRVFRRLSRVLHTTGAIYFSLAICSSISFPGKLRFVKQSRELKSFERERKVGMANLFIKQAKQYAETRPTYPDELFRFIASKIPTHDLVWDAGTGSGQAAKSLSEIFKEVIATDTSPKQLEFAPKLPNIRYHQTPPTMSMSEVHRDVAESSIVDLVTVAQALHWFDLPSFYRQCKYVLKKPYGTLAAWCYTTPEVNASVDSVFAPFYADSRPYWEAQRELVDDMYRSISFPFEALEGLDGTGPFKFKAERLMKLEDFFTYIRSWSAYQTAKEKGVELLNEKVVKEFTNAWLEDGKDEKVVNYPVYLRIGKVGDGK